MSRVFQSYQPFQHIPLRLDINSILIGLAAVLFVDVTPIEYAILTLSGVRVRLDVISFFIGGVILISIPRYTARLVDTANLYTAAFITLLILSSQWSPSQIAVDVYIMQALTIIPLAYGLGLCMGRCHPIYVAVLYILVAIPTYFYFNPNFSDYKSSLLLYEKGRFTYQAYADCYFLAAFGAIVCAVHVQRPVLRFGLFAMALFFSIAMLQSGGRGGILTLGASIAAVTVYQFPRWRWPIVLILPSIGLITNFISDAALFELYKFAHSNGLFSVERLLAKLIFNKVDVRGRDDLAMLAVAVWSDHPFLGIGLGGFPMTAGLGDHPGWYPHNMFLEVLAEQGVVGFIVFGGLIWLIVSRYMRIRVLLPNTYKVYIVGFTAAALVRTMFSGHIESDPQLWILAGFIVSLSWEYERATWVCLRMLPARHQQEGTAAIGSGAKPRPENAKRRRPW